MPYAFAISLLLLILTSSALTQSQQTGRDVALSAPDGTALKATYYASAQPGPAVLLLHMCNTTRKSWEPLGPQLAGAGIHALSVDYRGFGESGGDRSDSLAPQDAQRVINEKWPGDIDAAYRYQREFDAGQRRIVGVNAYIDETEETTVPVLAVPPGSLERQLARLERTRRERDAGAVEAALRGLREAASRPGSTETNLMPHFIRGAAAYATLGEMCGVLRGVFGEYREPVAV